MNGLVAHLRRVHHIYSNTAWLCISLPRHDELACQFVEDGTVVVSITHGGGSVLQKSVVCMHKSLPRDGILFSKWPVLHFLTPIGMA